MNIMLLNNIKLQLYYSPKIFDGWNVQVYYSEEIHSVPVEMVKGKCEVMKKWDLPSCDVPATFEHVFFCERQFDPSKGSLKLVVCS